MATLIHLRHDLPHAVLGLLFGVDRSTMTRAIGQIRALLSERGCAAPNRPGVRRRTLEDVFAYARAEGVKLRLDATEVQVRRPRAGRGGRLGQEEAEHDEGHRRGRPPRAHVVDRRDAAGATSRIPYGTLAKACAVRTTQAWIGALAEHGLTTGPLLRSIDRHGRLASTPGATGRGTGG